MKPPSPPPLPSTNTSLAADAWRRELWLSTMLWNTHLHKNTSSPPHFLPMPLARWLWSELIIIFYIDCMKRTRSHDMETSKSHFQRGKHFPHSMWCQSSSSPSLPLCRVVSFNNCHAAPVARSFIHSLCRSQSLSSYRSDTHSLWEIGTGTWQSL